MPTRMGSAVAPRVPSRPDVAIELTFMECRRFRDIADSYLSEELLVETNHEVLRHLESCPTCRTELAARRQVRRVLRSALANSQELKPSSDFRDRVQQYARAQLAERESQRQTQTRRARLGRWLRRAASPLAISHWGAWRWAVVAAVLVIVAGGGGVMLTQGWLDSDSELLARSNPTGTPSGRALMEVAPFATGDHRECALEGRPEAVVALDEAGRKFDPVYTGLADAVRRDKTIVGRKLSADVVDGHSCVFQGRRFGHVMLKSTSGRLVSVLVTNFAVNQKSTGLARLTGRDGTRRVAPCSQNADFRVACFRAPHHAVFVVSDLLEQDNLALARAVAPSLQQHLAALGDKHAHSYTTGLGEFWTYSNTPATEDVTPGPVLAHPLGN
jgi:hypothetical protein